MPIHKQFRNNTTTHQVTFNHEELVQILVASALATFSDSQKCAKENQRVEFIIAPDGNGSNRIKAEVTIVENH